MLGLFWLGIGGLTVVVYKCDCCGREIDGDFVGVLRATLPDLRFRKNKNSERYSHFEFCRECADNLPGPQVYKIEWRDMNSNKLIRVETGVDMYSLKE